MKQWVKEALTILGLFAMASGVALAESRVEKKPLTHASIEAGTKR